MLFGSQQTPQRRDSGKKSAAQEAGASRNWQSVILTALSFTQAPAPAQGNEHRPPGSGCTAPCPFHGFGGEKGEARGSLPLLLSSSSSSRGRPRGGQSLRARTATGGTPVSPFPSLFPTCLSPCLPAPTVRGAAAPSRAPPEPPADPHRAPTGLAAARSAPRNRRCPPAPCRTVPGGGERGAGQPRAAPSRAGPRGAGCPVPSPPRPAPGRAPPLPRFPPPAPARCPALPAARRRAPVTSRGGQVARPLVAGKPGGGARGCSRCRSRSQARSPSLVCVGGGPRVPQLPPPPLWGCKERGPPAARPPLP